MGGTLVVAAMVTLTGVLVLTEVTGMGVTT